MNDTAFSANGFDQNVSDTVVHSTKSTPSALSLALKPYGDSPMTATVGGMFHGAKIAMVITGVGLVGAAVLGTLARN